MPIVLGQQNASDSSRQSSNPMMLLPEMLFIPMLTSMHLVPISCVCTSSRQHGDFPSLRPGKTCRNADHQVPRHGCSGQPYYLLSCTSGEKHLTPEMQEQVKKVFAEYGYGEPAYDHYAEEIGFVYE